MDILPRLPRHERRRLLRVGRSSGDPATALRFQAVYKLLCGQRTVAVARALDLAVSTVVKAARRFADEGIFGLYDQRKGNGAAKVDADFRDELWRVLERGPQDFGWERPSWTRELLCLELDRRGFGRIAVCTMGRALRAIGARLGAPKPIVLCPWRKAERERRLRALRRLADRASAREPVFFCDEVDIHLNPKIGRDWMLPGKQRRVVTPGKNQKAYIAGALNARTGQLVWVDAEAKASWLFCKLLWRLVEQNRHARTIHLIVDNYVIHNSKVTREVLAHFAGKIRLHFLPPYCPDANRIERVWLDLHANVTRNHRCPTLLELMRHVRRFLNDFNHRHTRSPALRRAA